MACPREAACSKALVKNVLLVSNSSNTFSVDLIYFIIGTIALVLFSCSDGNKPIKVKGLNDESH